MVTDLSRRCNLGNTCSGMKDNEGEMENSEEKGTLDGKVVFKTHRNQWCSLTLKKK